MRGSGFRYDASDVTADLPLNVDEAEGLLASGGRGFIRDRKAVMHFVRRTVLALRSHQQDKLGLIKEVEAAHLERAQRGGQNSGLSPMQMMAYLSDEQMRTQFNGLYARNLTQLEAEHRKAVAAHQEAVADRARVRAAMNALLGDPRMPAPLRETALALLQAAAADSAPAAPVKSELLRRPGEDPPTA